MMLCCNLLITLVLVSGAAGLDASTNMIFLNDFAAPGAIKPLELTIRSSFKGSVEFLEGTKFGILVNITAPGVLKLSSVSHQISQNSKEITLQLYEDSVEETDSTIRSIVIAISMISGIVFFIMVLCTIVWFKFRQPIKKAKTSTSGMPLIVNSYSPSQNRKNIVEVRVSLNPVGSQSPTIQRKQPVKSLQDAMNDTLSSEEDNLRSPTSKDTSLKSTSSSGKSNHSSKSNKKNGGKLSKRREGLGDKDRDSIKPFDTSLTPESSPKIRNLKPQRPSALTYNSEDDINTPNDHHDNMHNERKEHIVNGRWDNDVSDLKSKLNNEILYSRKSNITDRTPDKVSPLSNNQRPETSESESESVVTIVSPGMNKPVPKQTSKVVVKLKPGNEVATSPPKQNIVNPPVNQGNHRPRMNGGPKHMPNKHLTTFTILSVISLATGVYSSLMTETEVNIKVYVPPGYLKSANIFVNKNVNVKIMNKVGSKLPVHLYDVKSTTVENLSKDTCQKKYCEHKCDQTSGDCVCRRGYRIYQNHKCTDISECVLDSHRCHKNARCLNTKGSYICACNKGYYGDGRTCQECTKTCPKNEYQMTPCNRTHDAQCAVCGNHCKQGQYEYMPCMGTSDRICRDTTELQFPVVSINTVFEDRNRSHSVQSQIRYFDRHTTNKNRMVYMMNRGSGLSLRLHLKQVNLLPNFQAVNHSHSNDNAGFYGNPRVMREYCPYPIPPGYQLNLVIHNQIMTKAKYVNCTKATGYCTEGYTLDPNQPCTTYKQFGHHYKFNPHGSLVCTEPGSLTNLYGVSGQFSSATNVFVDRSERCALLLGKCESCTISCSKDIQSTQAMCKVTSEEVDNGWSPRLQLCQTCCEDANCVAPCSAYNTCLPIRCRRGNLAEFTLTPAYPLTANDFNCHVEPTTNKPLYEIDYTLLQDGRAVVDKTFNVKRPTKKGDFTAKIDKHLFLNVHYSSSFDKLPDVVYGEINQVNPFRASQYNGSGDVIKAPINKDSPLHVRTTEPFRISSLTWKNLTCDRESLKHLRVNTGSPFNTLSDVNVERLGNGIYKLTNVTKNSQQPFIYFEIPSGVDLLPYFFEMTEIVNDASLQTDLVRNKTHWVVTIRGNILKCPGLLHVNVSEEDTPTNTVFAYNLAVKCPKSFFIKFNFPTISDTKTVKYVNIVIAGANKTVRIRQGMKKQSPVSGKLNVSPSIKPTGTPVSKSRDLDMSLSFALIGGFSSIIIVLGVLLFCGSILKSANVYPDSRLHLHHIVFCIGYVTFRVAYSLAMTFTVFILVWQSLNGGSWNTMKQYPSFMSSVGALQQLEAAQITKLVQAEIDRQDQIANHTKSHCLKQLTGMQEQVEQVQRWLAMDTERELFTQRISLIMFTQAQDIVQQLQDNLVTFREDYNRFVSTTMAKMANDIQNTVNGMSTNRWLKGALLIHSTVRDLRTQQGMSTKSFLDWMDLDNNITGYKEDLQLKDMPLPDISDFMAPVITTTTTPTMMSPQSVIPNIKWYVEYNNPQPIRLERKTRQPEISKWLSSSSLMMIVVLLDIIWLLHRAIQTYDIGRSFLYGSPVYVNCHSKQNKEKVKVRADSQESVVQDTNLEDSLQTAVMAMAREVHNRVMQTEFVPKLVSVVLVCVAVYTMLSVTDKVVSVSTLSSLGFFKALTFPTDTISQKGAAQVLLHAQQINQVELPFYDKMVSLNIERYQMLVQTFHNFDCKFQAANKNEFCEGNKPLKECTRKADKKYNVNFIPCHLPKVIPSPIQRASPLLDEENLSQTIMPYIEAVRRLVLETCHMIILFVAILVLVDMLGATLWLYLQRFKLVQEKLLYESEISPKQEHL